MKKTTQHPDVSVPQTVTNFIKVHNGQETIQFGFTNQRISAHAGLSAFGRLWRWSLDRLRARKDGYTLDVDSTQLLHEEGYEKEGVEAGYTVKGLRRAYHPLLAMIAEAKVVAGFWLRPGNTRCDSNVIGFMQELLARM